MRRMIKNIEKDNIIWLSVGLTLLLSTSLAMPAFANGGSLYLAPSKGTFLVGSTFSISVVVDTKEEEINAVQVDLKFPPDILQVTTPTAGESFISEWLTPPTYSNIGGFINFKGGIPEGIVTSAGLVSTITFRAKSTGVAEVEFLDSSKILLKDGKGTPISTKNFGGTYRILIPPPEGPKITSVTHPDSDIWYSDANPAFSWEKEEGVSDFSFSFSQNPQEIPDDVAEGPESSTSYSGISDGIWYFHLRAKKDGLWGRTSHFEVKIDTTSPEKFGPRVELPAGFVYFNTKDLHSGIDHYEISVLNITESPSAAPFFIEATSPYKIPHEELGYYRIIVRAYDRAGNWQIAESKFRMISPILSIIEGKGIQVKGILFPWWLIYLILFLLVGGMSYLIFYLATRKVGFKRSIKEIEEALEEIKKVEEREREARELKERFEEEKRKLEERL